MISQSKPKKKNLVLIPDSMISGHYVGPIWGHYAEASGVFNIIGTDEYTPSGVKLARLGEIGTKDRKRVNELYGAWENNNLHFSVNDDPFSYRGYGIVQDIFSRNTGILETETMREKIAFIIGCGSVGSLVALELARAGVGNFILLDHDILEYHNICRHQCSLYDVGEFKVDALGKRILAINPTINIEKFTSTIELIPKEVFDKSCIPDQAIIIGCADNREADVYANGISAMYKVPFISIGFWERAFAGELFYYLPGENMPCYKCALGSGSGLSQRASVNRRLYTTQESLENVRFEPGISVDINFVTIIGIKIILDILNRNNPGYALKLLPHLQQYTLICNTNNPEIGGEMAEIFSYPLQVTTSIKVGFSPQCPPCEYE